jgi:hypothetical protein
MPRRNRRKEQTPPPRAEPVSNEIGAPKGWTAQKYQSRDAGADYVCPRCHRPVARMTQHIVAWAEDDGSDKRRHWHSACWTSATREGIDRYRWA